MRSAIWKLSALATVIGLGLVAVVMQQKGLGLTPGKPNEKAAATTPAAPGAKAAGAKTSANEKAQTPDPFTDGGESAPTQLQSPDPETEAPVTVASNGAPGESTDNSTESFDEADTFATGTKPRIQPRALNFKDQVDTEQTAEDGNSQLVESGAGVRDRVIARENVNNGGADPSEMEGVPAEDNKAGVLTDDADPFERRRQLAAQRTGNRGKVSARQSPAESTDPIDQSGSNTANPFEQDSASEQGGGPVVPVPANGRPNPRTRLIDDGNSEYANNGSSAVSDAGSATQFESDQAAPAGYQADAGAGGATGNRGSTASKSRPMLTDDDDEPKKRTDSKVAPTAPAGAAATKPAGQNKRPQFTNDDDVITPRTKSAGTPQTPTTPRQGPNLDKDSATTDAAMPPPLPPTKSGRVRPNPFGEDGDGPGGFGATKTPPPPTGSESNSPNGPNGPEASSGTATDDEAELPKDYLGRPSKHIMNVDPDDRSALPGVPEAAASSSSQTNIIDAPQPIPGISNPSGMGSTSGRGRITIEKTAPPTAYVGQPLIYQIVVRNLGNVAAQQVIVEDVLPDGVTIQGSIPQGELTGRKLAWRIGSLSIGEERKISVKVIPSAAGSIGSAAKVKFVTDQAFASTDLGDPAGLGVDQSSATTPRTAPRTNRRTSPRTNPVVGGNGVQIGIDGPQQVSVGQTVEYRFRITNGTGTPLNNLMVRNVLSRSLLHETRFQDLEYQVGTLAPGETREVPLKLTATQSGRAISRVIAMTGPDQILTSDEYTLEIIGGSSQPRPASTQNVPRLSVDVIPPSGPVQIGSQFAYDIRLINRGTVPVRQAAVKLSLPPELKLVNAGPVKYRQSGSDLVFDAIPILDAGQQTVLRAEFLAQTAGEAILQVQFAGAHMQRPLTREEGLQISER